jgi:hypothetical protein
VSWLLLPGRWRRPVQKGRLRLHAACSELPVIKSDDFVAKLIERLRWYATHEGFFGLRFRVA